MENRKFISRAAVIGAGSMGAGIAAHLANSGVQVDLFDVPADGDDRDARAKAGIEKQLKARGFMSKRFAENVRPGNIEDHLDRLAEAEWIVEAVFEDINVKHDTFAKIAAHRAPGTPVSSNTSTIPLSVLSEGMDQDMLPDFAIIHFFNPPRVMPLVELVRGTETSEDTATTLTRICEQQLGKVVIDCRDTPGFIANRIGNFWMAVGAAVALRDDIAPELADTAFGKPFGVPRTGIFGLFDYVGLQLVPPIWGSLLKALPETDAYHSYDITKADVVTQLLDKGLTGRTNPEGAGFYRNKGLEVYDPQAGDYRARVALDDAALRERDAKALMGTDTPAGRYAREVFLTTLRYCCDTAPEITDSVSQIDEAMALGYGWKQGPFALADSIGIDWLLEAYVDDAPELLEAAATAGGFYPEAGKVLSSSGTVIDLPEREGVVTVAQLTDGAEVIVETEGAQVFKLDDDVAIFAMRTPMNSLHRSVLDAMEQTARREDIRALVIANDEARAFSAGADLKLLSELAKSRDETGIRQVLRQGAEALEQLRRAPFPVVGAVRGVALGGGLETVMHCDATVIHAETRLGFPEPNVGIIPGWGGTVRSLERLIDNGVENPHLAAFSFIMASKQLPVHAVAEQGFLREDSDRIVLSAQHVVADALELARDLADGYTEPGTRELPLYPAEAPKLEYTEGTATDLRISQAIGATYTAQDGDGETIDSFEMGKRETRNTVPLLEYQENIDRVVQMYKNPRQPLRN
ncbi:3-hydroxyacyl-CoA dehydrogenase/enoyl-CoA hydratase family protein [Corynebacterium lubricantis]|uniref:3-hydroxyacyl-CoA dehydrogenase/enoyl-CoA hydratase family protein n=1 Tax=Corynebacterium lubricantis TaxID=541095 RepID=UPI0003713B09|nr:3-hydroxyacyl-CoA dehydrogenase/enoyl-CoA hydratase family protein [Corynebacterium lubricantis]